MAGPPFANLRCRFHGRNCWLRGWSNWGSPRLLQGNRSGVIFPHRSRLHFKCSSSPAPERIRSVGSPSTTLVLPAERAAVLLAKGPAHAGYGPRDTAVQHGTASFRDNGGLQQLVIIQGTNRG